MPPTVTPRAAGANSAIDLGIAIDSPDGLFVPVLRDVATSNPQDWRRQIDAAKSGVKERTLPPAEFRNPTITLSNFGTIAGQHAALVIMPPQVAIVGVGRARLKTRLMPQGANIPCTPEAEAALHKMGVLVIPDFIANAGGVICASIEFRGGTQRAAFDYIDERIRTNTRLVLEESRRTGGAPRAAAMALAQDRVRAATKTRRWQ
jgi:hypothetical protein